MRLGIPSAVVAIAVAGAAFCVACGDQGSTSDEMAEEHEGGVRQKAEALEHAAEEGALRRAERAVAKVGREAAHEVKEQGVVGAIEEGAEILEEHVKDAAGVAKETFQADREEGVGRIQAAGEAYEEVLEVPKKRADAKMEAKDAAKALE